MNIRPHIVARRGELIENTHRAWVCLWDETSGLTQMFPQSDTVRIFLRSAAKPFQALPLLAHPNSTDLCEEAIAIICASHGASDEHLHWVDHVLTLADCDESQLFCGPHPPIDRPSSEALIRSGNRPGKRHNNCSGKHAGMLLACRWYGWPLENYQHPDHPLQQAILSGIQELSGEHNITQAIDGCGAPVFGLSGSGIARLFSTLATDARLSRIAAAMASHPVLIGDRERIDTHLMLLSQGQLLAKVGAEGMLAVCNRHTRQGLMIKLQDGDNSVRDRLAITILQDLAWLTADQVALLRGRPAFSLERRNTQDQLVGEYEITLDWVSPA